MTKVFPHAHLLRLGHILPGCDRTGLESSITPFSDNSIPLMSLPPSWFYTPDEPELEILVPPRELSGPDNDPERQGESSVTEPGLLENGQAEEEMDSNLAFRNPRSRARLHRITIHHPDSCRPDHITALCRIVERAL